MNRKSAGKFLVRSRAVYTGVSGEPKPASILVSGQRIEKILAWDAPETQGRYSVYDYGDQMIMPSFIDAHTHLFQGAIGASDYVCSALGGCTSEKECADMIGVFAKEHPDYPVIRGSGWFLGAWENAVYPDCRSLDETVPDRPVFLMNADCHSMWLNSKALKMAGIHAYDTVENGEVVKFPDGTLTGLLLEPEAYAPAEKIFSSFTQQELYEIHSAFQQQLARYGIGALSEMFAHDYSAETEQKYDVVKRLDEAGGMSAHVYVYTRLFGYAEFSKFREMKQKYNLPHFHIAGVKGFIDGVTETYTGLLLEPYTDRPDTCGDGLPLWPRDRMEKEIMAANAERIQVRLHCIADGSVRMALDIYEKSRQHNGEQDLRNTIEHIENIHPSDIERFRELGVIPSMQPYHLTLSNNDKVIQLGKERCQYEFPVRTVYRANGMLAIGTDYPVVTIDPFTTIYAAYTRCDDHGIPTGQNSDTEKLDMEEILRAYTIEGARVYHVETEMGTLEEGKLADFIVLSQNLFHISPEEIRQTRVVANYFEGREIYHE